MALFGIQLPFSNPFVPTSGETTKLRAGAMINERARAVASHERTSVPHLRVRHNQVNPIAIPAATTSATTSPPSPGAASACSASPSDGPSDDDEPPYATPAPIMRARSNSVRDAHREAMMMESLSRQRLVRLAQRWAIWVRLLRFFQRTLLAERRRERLLLHLALCRLHLPLSYANAARAAPGILRRHRLRAGYWALRRPAIFNPSLAARAARKRAHT